MCQPLKDTLLFFLEDSCIIPPLIRYHYVEVCVYIHITFKYVCDNGVCKYNRTYVYIMYKCVYTFKLVCCVSIVVVWVMAIIKAKSMWYQVHRSLFDRMCAISSKCPAVDTTMCMTSKGFNAVPISFDLATFQYANFLLYVFFHFFKFSTLFCICNSKLVKFMFLPVICNTETVFLCVCIVCGKRI